MTEKTLLTIGEVTGVHGLGGNLKVRSFAESKDAYAQGRFVWIKGDDGDGIWYEIERASEHKKGLLLALKGIENRDDAECLVGAEIRIKREHLEEPEEDAYFRADLIGLDVMDENRGYAGRVEHIFDTGAHDVLVVKNAETGIETLVPATFPIVAAVDVKGGVIKTRMPEGL
ncbi:MAG: ribosome maturation factor RimM [Desulfarculaceae bacterium]|nr:ribosome maturation factor RimM [Desulfarculaceae bacterium]